MKNNDKTELFETLPIPKATAALCIPTVLSALVMMTYSLADTFFVGELNDAVQNAGVTLAAPVLLAYNAVTNLFGVGSSSKLSRALGEKRLDIVRGTSAFGFYSALFFAVMMSLLCTVFKAPLLDLLGADLKTRKATSDYLFWTLSCGAVPAIMNVIMSYLVRSEGSALHAGVGTISGCILNIILDPFFILPRYLGMGAAGAGLATFISNSVAFCYFLVLMYVKRGSSFISISPRDFCFKREIVTDVCRVGVPAAVQNLLNVTGMTILNNFTAAYDSAAVAAMGISHKISLIPMYASMGLSQGIMPLVSYNYASGNYKRMKSAIKFTTAIGLCLITVLAVLLFIFPSAVITAFLNDGAVIAYGSRFLRAMTLALPFLSFDFIAVAIFQSCGMGGRSLIFAISRKLVLEIPAMLVLNRVYPLYGLAYAQLVPELTLSAAAVFVLNSIFKRLSTTT